jgi:5S rRNA maturation endonuclease (ribonuclease M5)
VVGLANGKQRSGSIIGTIIGIIKSMQNDDIVVIVEGKHDIEALKNTVDYLSSNGLISDKAINAVTIDKLRYNHLDIDGKKIIIATDDDRAGDNKKEQAIALIRAKYPNSTIDENTGIRLLKILGTNIIEGIMGPIKDIIGIDEFSNVRR